MTYLFEFKWYWLTLEGIHYKANNERPDDRLHLYKVAFFQDLAIHFNCFISNQNDTENISFETVTSNQK